MKGRDCPGLFAAAAFAPHSGPSIQRTEAAVAHGRSATLIAQARLIIRLGGLGSPAEVALLRIEDGEFPLVDSQSNTFTAKQRTSQNLRFAGERK